jgi:hypothetical protein
MRQVFYTSRFYSLFFPPDFVITDNDVTLIVPTATGKAERCIQRSQIASVSTSTGLFFGSLRIESTGGIRDIVVHGLSNDSIPVIKRLLGR